MLNFLYCFDDNYNVPAFASMHSLLNNINEKVNIFVIHKSEDTPSFIPELILNSRNLNEIQVYRFDIKELKFHNLNNAHVSEATFYRLFLLNYLPKKLNYIIYLDADVFCISNPLEALKNEINTLSNSKYEVGFSSESKKTSANSENFSRLNLKGDSYFNAGVMILDINKAYENGFTQNVSNLLLELGKDAIFWDQDILNKYYDNNFLEIEGSLNYKINYFSKDYSKILNNSKDEISLVHYSGKFKPWNIRGISHSTSFIFQDLYKDLFKKHYFISNARRRTALKDIIKIVITLKFKHIKYPLNFLLISIKYLFKKTSKHV
jgi:lipopolysaccharide biosynthesis glycosyltransferase|tara:strand:- start:9697 stop:10659 length:963 start_codon:yes stop_codon:yes gene_type:complete